jgi:hypothetical protein
MFLERKEKDLLGKNFATPCTPTKHQELRTKNALLLPSFIGN